MAAYFKLEELSDDHGRLKVSGEATIAAAAEAREHLLAAIERLPSLEVDLSGVEAADLAFVQVICAAHRECVVRGREIRLSSTPPDCVRQAMEQSGYQQRYGCPAETLASCVWCKNNQCPDEVS